MGGYQGDMIEVIKTVRKEGSKNVRKEELEKEGILEIFIGENSPKKVRT
jgi:hypothetical protein